MLKNFSFIKLFELDNLVQADVNICEFEAEDH